MNELKKQINNFLKRGESDFLSCKVLDSFLSTLMTEEDSDLQWFELEQPELFIRISEKPINIPDIDYCFVRNKINALKTVLMCDSFFMDLDIFQKIVCAISDVQVIDDHFVILELSDIIFTLNEISHFEDFNGHSFSNEIKAYIASICKEEGLIVVPDELKFCQEQLNKINGEEFFKVYGAKIKAAKLVSIDILDPDSLIDNQAIKLLRIDSYVLLKDRKLEV